MPEIHVDAAMRSIVTLGAVEVRGVAAAADRPELDREVERHCLDLRRRCAGASAGAIPHLRPARELYRALGIDPTRHRPSPEALLRRVLRGDPFPRIHPAVDLGNLWALLHGLPVGLYDLERIAGPIHLRLGQEGESYVGIRKDEVHLTGRLALADSGGPFGNPTADSLRTAVTATTRNLLYVLFAPVQFDPAALTEWLDWLRVRALSVLRGDPGDVRIVT